MDKLRVLAMPGPALTPQLDPRARVRSAPVPGAATSVRPDATTIPRRFCQFARSCGRDGHSPTLRPSGRRLWGKSRPGLRANYTIQAGSPVFVLVALLVTVAVDAESNINPEHALAWGANIGWTNWRPSATDGAEVGEFVCSGFVFGANVGWINLGNGKPINGIHYQNRSAADFGVNHDQQGRLWGLAYGANIGWIHFETNGAPRIDLRTGDFTGHAYSANAGWFNLGNSNLCLRIDSVTRGSDADADGIPDAWELTRAGNLDALSRDGDLDKDGFSDCAEYLADTDPADPKACLAILDFSTAQSRWISHLKWLSQPTRQYRVLARRQFGFDSAWRDAGVPIQAGDGNPISVVITNQAGLLQGFYQIEAIRPLMP